jgi:hypothetical protein
MTLVDDRPRFTPQADAEVWLAAFEAALQSRDAAPGHAALTGLLESGTNCAATIIGNSRQNLGSLGLIF